MGQKSLFSFSGELLPGDLIPEIRSSYSINRPSGSFRIDVDGREVTLTFVAEYESFDDLYYETYQFALSFFSVGALRMGIPIQLILHEWTEKPLHEEGKKEQLHPVRGTIAHHDPDQPQAPILQDQFIFGLSHGLTWSEDLATSPFLRRAVLDFNYALSHPVQDVVIYLARSIESVQAYFEGEGELISNLDVSSQVKNVKRLANDFLGGRHTRHAARTEETSMVTKEEVLEAAEATREVLSRFHMHLMTKRMKRQDDYG